MMPIDQDIPDSVRPLKAVVIFVDVRGFSNWSISIEAHEDCLDFVAEFYEILKKKFLGFRFKGIGDGALLVRPFDVRKSSEVNDAIEDVLVRTNAANHAFADLVEDHNVRSGVQADLWLGWGVARGPVIPMATETDFLGATVNRACRLCDMARPYGIVIDRDNFPVVRGGFFEQIRRLTKPSLELKVWVSEAIFLQHSSRESLRETPEVHIAGLCACPRRGLLIAKRAEDRQLSPGKWEGCGGQLRRRESFRQGVIRHFRVELSMTVDVIDLEPEVFEIALGLDGVIPGLLFLCRPVEGEPVPSSHSEVRWVDPSELEKYDLAPGFFNSARRLLRRWAGYQPNPSETP